MVDLSHKNGRRREARDYFLLGVDLEINYWTAHFNQSGRVNPLSSHSLDLLVVLSNSFIKLDGSASLSVKYLAKSNKDRKNWIPNFR